MASTPYIKRLAQQNDEVVFNLECAADTIKRLVAALENSGPKFEVIENKDAEGIMEWGKTTQEELNSAKRFLSNLMGEDS